MSPGLANVSSNLIHDFVPFSTLLNYQKNGGTELNGRSLKIKLRLKAGTAEFFNQIIAVFESNKTFFEEHINPGVTLVPVPGHARRFTGQKWNTFDLSEAMAAAGFAKDCLPLLERTTKVPQSSLISSADDRPSVQEHIDSMTVRPELTEDIGQICLVDDVISLGRTSYACYKRLKDAYPKVDISIFTVMYNCRFQDLITKIVEPRKGRIRYNLDSGKTSNILD